MMGSIKPAVTVSVDPDLHEKVGSYIQDNEGADWNQIVNESLRYWHDSMPRKSAAAPRSCQGSLEQCVRTLARHANELHIDRWHQPR